AQDKKDEDPGSQHRGDKGEDRPAPQRRIRPEQQRQQDAKLRRGDGGSGGWGHKLVHAELLHDEARYAHPNSGAQHRQQARQAGNQKNFQLLQVPRQQAVEVQVDDADKQREDGQHHQTDKKDDRYFFYFDKNSSLSSLHRS